MTHTAPWRVTTRAAASHYGQRLNRTGLLSARYVYNYITGSGLSQLFFDLKGRVNFVLQRAALYIRVSTEDQATFGYSLEAQREKLTKYAKEHNLMIVDYYVDDGASARKKYTTRKEFMRMLRDVEADKIDLILFIKLDRWFRSVSDYYKVQETLDAHHVSWKATEEQFDTTTTNGRLYTNIRLSLAQDEADRTSDRIKFVFASKVKRGEVITGKVPPGFKIENKRLVHDPEKVDMVRELFLHYAEHGSKHGAVQHVFDSYGVKIDRHYFQQMLRNTLYKGEYRGIQNFCEPIIEPALFDRLNAMPNIKAAPSRRIYIFSGLVVCAECGTRMSGRHSSNVHGSEYMYYRCNRYSNFGDCTNDKLANEQAIEQWLLDHVEEEANKRLVEYKAEAVKRKKPEVDRAAIKRKLSRLKDLYVNEAIDLEEYKRDYDLYTAQLAENPEQEEPKLNVEGLKKFLENDLHSIYQNLDREQRRTLWRGIIRGIRIDSQKHITILF